MRNDTAAVLVVLMLCGPASAQVIYKCTGKPGRAVYQDYPCRAGAATAGVRTYTPEPDSRPYRPQQQAASVQPRSDASGTQAVLHSVPLGNGQCESTRQARDAWERRVGLRRTIDDLRFWNDQVARACN